MLAYVLAITVGCGSFALYMAAFFFPEVHRKYDFLWSGVAMFYALVLWVCAGRITGGVLLGQCASVALLGWFSWQTLTLRRDLTPAALQTQADSQTWRSQLQTMQQQVQEQVQATLQGRSQTLPKSTWTTVSARLIELVTHTRALVRGIWETSRRSLPMSKPAKPSRPTLVRSPSAKKDRVSKTNSVPGVEQDRAEKSDAVDLETAIGNPNLANPNDSLELWEDDFEEDTSTPPEAIAPNPDVPDPDMEDRAELDGDRLLESEIVDSTDGVIVEDSIAPDLNADSSAATDLMTAIASDSASEPPIAAETHETPAPGETKEPPQEVM